MDDATIAPVSTQRPRTAAVRPSLSPWSCWTGLVMPCDTEKEVAILGHMICGPSQADEAAAVLKPADFYGERQRELFTTLAGLRAKPDPAARERAKALAGELLLKRGKLDDWREVSAALRRLRCERAVEASKALLCAHIGGWEEWIELARAELQFLAEATA